MTAIKHNFDTYKVSRKLTKHRQDLYSDFLIFRGWVGGWFLKY
jgi:hypothetical protein